MTRSIPCTVITLLTLLPLAPGCTPSHPTSSVATPTTKPTADANPMTAYRTESEQARRAYGAALSLAAADHATHVKQADRAYAAARQRAVEDLTARRSAAADRVIADYNRRIARLQSAGQSDAAIAAQVAREQFRSAVEADNRRDTDLATLPTTHPTAAACQRAVEDLTARRSAAADRVIADYDRRIARLQSAGQSDAAIAAQVAREQFRAAVEADNRRDTNLATFPTTHPTAAAFQVLDLQATIDGSDELRITPAGLQWTHKSWDPPTNILVNGRAWNPQDGPLPLDRAGLTLTPDDFHNGSIRVLSHSGRDTVAVQPDPDAVTVFFSDDENGPAPYHVRIQFLPAPSR